MVMNFLIPAALQTIGGMVQGNINRDVSARATDAARESSRRLAELYAPYREVGMAALGKLGGYMAGTEPVETTPEYNWQANLLKQRLASIGQSGGGTANAAYFSPLIASEYANRINRLLPAINLGLSGTGGLAGAISSESGATQRGLYEGAPQYGSLLGSLAGGYMGYQDLASTDELRKAIIDNYKQFGAKGSAEPEIAPFYQKQKELDYSQYGLFR